MASFHTPPDSIFISSSLISKIHVIGQDRLCQIILGMANISSRSVLIALDQHAADERIRLEKIMSDNGSVLLEKPVDCQFDLDLRVPLNTLLAPFEAYGFKLTLTTHSKSILSLVSVPSFLINQSQNLMIKLVHTMIMDIIYEQYSFQKIPTSLYNVMKSSACHGIYTVVILGAVKFGDKLSLKQIDSMLERLSHCSFPFICAHGRRLLIPVGWIK